ncbi:MAG: hypothetical protein ACFFDF_23365 [Candidatus Odinarchaeota archaeon]
MSRDFSEFDKFKRDLNDRWAYISVYDIEGLEDLLFDSFKPYIFSLMNKKRDVIAYIERFSKKVKNFYLTFRITKGFKETDKEIKGTLEKYLEREH